MKAVHQPSGAASECFVKIYGCDAGKGVPRVPKTSRAPSSAVKRLCGTSVVVLPNDRASRRAFPGGRFAARNHGRHARAGRPEHETHISAVQPCVRTGVLATSVLYVPWSTPSKT